STRTTPQHRITIHTRPHTPHHTNTPWNLTAEGYLRSGSPDTVPAGEPKGPGTTVEAELSERDRVDKDRYGLHPALWDAALAEHPFEAGPGHTAVPVEWRGVRLFATGASAVRAQVTETGERSLALRLTDASGELVASVESVVFRDVPTSELATAGVANDAVPGPNWLPVDADGLRTTVRWGSLGGRAEGAGQTLVTPYDDVTAVGKAARGDSAPDAVIFELPTVDPVDEQDLPGTAGDRVVAVLRDWLADSQLAGIPLVVVVRDDRAGADGESVSAEVRALVRSAQAEAPGRLVLVDADDTAAPWRPLEAVLASGNAEAALREGRAYAPRQAAAGTGVRRRTAADGSLEPPLAQRLAGMDVTMRHEAVLDVVRTVVASVLGHADPAAIAGDRSFQELGLDSLTALDLRRRLSHTAGVQLPTTVVFDHPTPDALTGHLLSLLVPEASSGAALDELARLETALASASPDDEDRSEVTARLRALLARLTQADVPEGSDAVHEIEEASTDQIFAFIDNQLGRTTD
ncbi:phosphopantetheine-binding protein, partial [Streptomyces sp. NPDC088180]|uniref:phosphopantetheine-binding protein n=1 Tax=Streptomyces sp. NPDC088180 TaxID=3365837 RepID=UPI0038148BC7